MSKRQLALLFGCQLIIWWVGVGLWPLLPVYAAALGAAPSTIGIFFALLSTSVTAGSAVARWPRARCSSAMVESRWGCSSCWRRSHSFGS
jgi:hypothetical protein